MTTARTVQEVIKTALRKIGEYDSGETVSDGDMQTGLDAFQDLISEWAADGVLIPSITTDSLTLVIGQVTYTLGENGSPDLSTVRPERITGAYVQDSSGYDYHVQIIGERAYRAIRDKDLAGGSRPDNAWYNATAPNGTLEVWPAPANAETMYLTGEKPITEPSTLTQNLLDDLSIPRNYANPIIYNLSVHLAPEFGSEPTQTIIGLAGSGLNKIRGLNAARRAQPAQLEIAPQPRGRQTILSF